MIKAGGKRLHKEIHSLIKSIWETERMPGEWTRARICPIHKKGDKMRCENYRGIALLEVVYKILTNILRKKLNQYTEKILGEYQAGFRSNRSTTDQIFALKEIQTTCYEHKIAVYVLFVDFKQAYDTVKRQQMYALMKEMGIPSKIVRMVKMTMDNSTNEIAWKGHKSNNFETKEGLRQGDPLSTTLFNVILEGIIRKSKISTQETIFKNGHQCIAFADDLTLLSTSKKELTKLMSNIIKQAKPFGLLINKEKTKYMIMGETDKENEDNFTLEIEGENVCAFKRVSEFTYLGVKVDEKGHGEGEIKARIAKANKKYGALRPLMKSKDVSRKTKIRIYKTVIRPTATYACETWVLKKSEIDLLERWERKIQRAIYGGVKIDGQWRRRNNKELEELYNEPKITTAIKAQRIRYLGHIERMGKARMPKMVLLRKPIQKRRIGRPRRRWKDSVYEDLKQSNIVNWKEKALDRKQWKEVVKKCMERL